MLTTDSTKHLFNLYIYTTESEKNISINYSFNVEMNEYANIYKQIAHTASVLWWPHQLKLPQQDRTVGGSRSLRH